MGGRWDILEEYWLRTDRALSQQVSQGSHYRRTRRDVALVVLVLPVVVVVVGLQLNECLCLGYSRSLILL